MHFNTYWYLGLSILSIILLIFTYLKSKNSRIILLFISMVGVGYIIEAVIYNFFRAYQYFPLILTQNSVYDSNMGAIASNALTLPIAATFLAAFRKGWGWILFFVAIFAGIELLFLELNIYSHNWWRTGYTSLGLPFYFYTAKWIYEKLLRPLKGITHSLILYLVIGPFSGTLHILPIMFFSSRYYNLGWYNNHSLDTNAFAAIFYLAACLFYVTLAKLNLITTWLKYMLIIFFMGIATILLYKADILHSSVWWDPYYFLLISIFLLSLTIKISKHLSLGPEIMKKSSHLD